MKKVSHIYEFRGKIVVVCSLILLSFTQCNKNIVPEKSNEIKTVLRGKDLQNYNYLFSEALKQKIQGNFQKAIIYYQECLKINPESDASMYELSALFSSAGNYKKSLDYARKAVDIDPMNIWYLLNLANLYQGFDLKDSSIAVFKKIHELYPERTDLYILLGNLYADNGNYKKALNVFDEVEKHYGLQENIMVNRIKIYEQNRNFDKAKNEISLLIKNFPGKLNNLLMAAEFYYSQGNFREAEKYYSKAEIIKPGDPQIKGSMLGFYRKKNNYDRFFNLVDTLIVGDKISTTKKLQLISSLINDPKELADHSEPIRKSIDLLKKVDPDENKILILKGDYYARMNKNTKAQIAYRQYLKNEQGNYDVWQQALFLENLNENYDTLYADGKLATRLFQRSPVLYLFYGIACNQLKKEDEALEVFKTGLQYVGDNERLALQYYSLLGETYRNLGNYELSDTSFEKALKIDSQDQIVLNNYAYYLSLRNTRLEKALKMSKQTIKKEPKNSTYLDTYGWILFSMKKYNEAEKYLKKAILLDSNPGAVGLEHYGDALWMVNKKKEAILFWKKAIEKGGVEEKLKNKINNGI